MAGWPPEKNAAFTWYFVIRDADGDPVASAAALDVESSGDGAVFADVAGTEVDEGEGLYSCPISAAEMNFDVVALICKTSTAGAKTAAQVIYTSTRQIDDLAFPTTSGRSLDVTAAGTAGIDWGNVENPTTAVDLSATDIQLCDTVTTNTDMRGTDSAALASVVGALADAAAAGDPTTADTIMQYVKQLVNVLVGADGVTTFPAEAAPANNVSLAEVIRAIHADVTGVAGAAMRGTDSAALASVATEARLAELDAANLPSDVDAILVDTGTTLDGRIPAALVSGRMDSSVGAMATNVMTDAAANADLFDGLYIRDVDQVEASAPLHSLTTAVLKAISRVRDNAGTLEVYRTDGTTVHMSQTVTVDATLDPIDELTVGV